MSEGQEEGAFMDVLTTRAREAAEDTFISQPITLTPTDTCLPAQGFHVRKDNTCVCGEVIWDD